MRTTGTICQARSRLGEELVRVLSGRIAEPLADPGRRTRGWANGGSWPVLRRTPPEEVIGLRLADC